MDSSPTLMWDDPTLYSGSRGVMDPTIRDLDQQIILNDMILCANGGMPYLSQDPALQVNHPPVVARPAMIGNKENPDPRRNPHNRGTGLGAASTPQQKRKKYHQHQHQQYERRISEFKAAATATAAATLATEAAAVVTTVPPPQRDVGRAERDMPRARRELEEMGNHLRNVAHQQRMMIKNETPNDVTGSHGTRVIRHTLGASIRS
ncbi:hypothetical protein PG994_008947 [Apiospora phragmitis]|uniref:Uncharacterized protein n=1 Tax=Apiospora phragmitis TaxID=2905665 RepID=A0ABR1UHW2_9PEZI